MATAEESPTRVPPPNPVPRNPSTPGQGVPDPAQELQEEARRRAEEAAEQEEDDEEEAEEQEEEEAEK